MTRKLAVLLCLLLALLSGEPARAQFADQATWGGNAGGSANAITLSIPNLSRHPPGVKFSFVIQNPNTTAATFSPGSGLSQVALRIPSAQGPVALVGQEFQIGNVATVVYDGAFYQVVSNTKANGINAPTSVYVATPADCWRTVFLGGGTFYTATVGAVGGFPAGCRLEFVNVGSRGKGLVVTGNVTQRLLGLMTVVLQNAGTAWIQTPPAFLASNPTFYVDFTLGSDDPAVSDGLVPGAGAFKTFQAASNVMQSFRTGGTIQADCESNYDQAVSIVGYNSTPAINVIGNPASPASCPWTRSAGDNVMLAQDHATVGFSGFQVGYASGGVAVAARQFSIVDLGTMNWASNSVTTVGASEMAKINVAGTHAFLSINGASFVTASGAASVNVGATLAVTSTFMSFWFVAANTALITGTPVWSVGAISGVQFTCTFNAVINLGAAYPGALTAGTPSFGCQHNP